MEVGTFVGKEKIFKRVLIIGPLKGEFLTILRQNNLDLFHNEFHFKAVFSLICNRKNENSCAREGLRNN